MQLAILGTGNAAQTLARGVVVSIRLAAEATQDQGAVS
jgi:hypothetical protein